jgi:hypothetical protein
MIWFAIVRLSPSTGFIIAPVSVRRPAEEGRVDEEGGERRPLLLPLLF